MGLIMELYMYKNIQIYKKYAKEFERTFGVRLMPDYWQNHLMGFDMVKFDKEVIKSPDNVSCDEQVRKVYGDKAAELIWKLLGNEDGKDPFKGKE
jgi:hypothetical protein